MQIRSLSFAATLLIASVTSAQDGSAIYDVEFNATWSPQTHPISFPPNPHFSPLIGATHNSSVTFWEIGGLATSGVELMAETGGTSGMRAEVNAAIAAGSADQVLAFGPISLSPASRTDRFTVTAEHSLMTLVSMLAPSPDWFVGVDSLELRPNGEWIDSLVIPLELYDSGTDSGVTYLSANANTAPQDPIAEIDTNVGPFQTQSTIVGTFTITRIASSSVYGCDVNPDGSMRALGAPPRIGQTTEIAIHDPVGTLSQPAPGGLLLAGQPDPNFPCGTGFPGLGLASIGATGEYLLSGPVLAVPTPAWNGSPVAIPLPIPNSATFVGVNLYLQGALADSGGTRAGFTDAVELYIGS